MLQVTIPKSEFFDETKQEFFYTKDFTLQLEHSLVSLSKWESKWCKPFLGKNEKSTEETIDYIKCMTINNNVSSDSYNNIPNSVFKEILEYIDAPMTATKFNDSQVAKKNREVVTSEIIYYWMVSYNIPLECQKWHLNRLLTFIKVCSIKSSPQKKMNRKEMLAERRAINEARRNQFNSKG